MYTARRPKINKICDTCGKSMIVCQSVIDLGKGKTCSKECAKVSISKTLMGRKNPAHSKKMLGRTLSKEHIEKLKKSSKRGSSHYKWIPDRSMLAKRQERNDMAYKEWRKEVWLRDNFKCKIANEDCNGKIEAHHILGWKDHPELRYITNNGITLCHAHHPRKRAEEKRLSPFFKELIITS